MVRSLEWAAPDRVRDAVASLGRTEDVCFSPGDRRLAIAGFDRDRVSVFDVELSADSDGVQLALTGGVEITSRALQRPHGVDFLDHDTVIVTSRSGDVCLFALPASTRDVPHHDVLPIATWAAGGASLLSAPGSVHVSNLDDGGHEVLICNNNGHTVTRHRLDAHRTVTSAAVLLQKWLDVPDSVSRTCDGRWIAVSNHTSRQVLLFDGLGPLGENADPAGVLRGVSYPHGLRFSPDGCHLFLADAGAPNLHIYASDCRDWRGVRYPAASLPIMDDETFRRARRNREEGGPKGVALDSRARVLAVTSECQPLACFAATDLLQIARSEQSLSEQPRVAVASELSLLAEHRHPEHEARVAQAEAIREAAAALDYMRNSASWRLTAPLRRLDSLFRRRS